MAARIVVHADGICEPRNPGGIGAWGFVILRDGTIAHRGRGVLGWGSTNNVAEYTACVQAVKQASALYPKHAKVLRSDSQLVIRQAQGRYAVRSPNIRPLYERLMAALDDTWALEWVPREENEAADLETREAVWESIGKWPLRGRLVADRPAVHQLPPRAAAVQNTLPDGRWF